MKCILDISYDDTTSPVHVSRHLVAIDENLICQMGAERPVDILMEILSAVSFPKTVHDITGPLQKLCENGYSTLRAAVPAGACSMVHANVHLSATTDHRIEIMIMHPDKDWSPNVWARLDDGDKIDISRDGFVQAPERAGSTEQVIFGDAYVSRYKDEIREDQLASGALLSGFCLALFERWDEVPRDRITKGHAMLCCAISAMSGAAFSKWTNRTNIEWAISAGSSQYENFVRNGHLVSDRGWNPQTFMAGPRLAEAAQAADPDLLSEGRKIYAEISDLEDAEARLVLVTLIEEFDVKLNQVSSYIKTEIPRDESNHGQLVRTGHARRIKEVICKMAAARPVAVPSE